MNFEETVENIIYRYPTLYLRSKWCEYTVMDHLFFVIGNGYEWSKGELTHIYCDGPRPPWTTFLKKAIYAMTVGVKHDAFWKKLETGNKKMAELRFYPFSEKHSMAFLVPEDVKQDWLEAVIHYLEFAESRPIESFYFLCDEWTEEQEIEHAIQKKEMVSKQLAKLRQQYVNSLHNCKISL